MKILPKIVVSIQLYDELKLFDIFLSKNSVILPLKFEAHNAMDKNTLLQRLTDIEWTDFEVKKASAEIPKDVWETVSAFSNTSGGWIVLGVSQNGKEFEVTGVANPEKIEQDFTNTLRSQNKFNIIITPECKKYTIDSKTVLAFYKAANGSLIND